MSSKKCEKSQIFLRKNKLFEVLKISFTLNKKYDIINMYDTWKNTLFSILKSSKILQNIKYAKKYKFFDKKAWFFFKNKL